MRALLAVLCILALAACSEGETPGPTTPRNEEAPNAVSRTSACSTSEFEVAFSSERVVVTSGGKELGHATTGNRDLTDVCRVAQPPGDARGTTTRRTTEDTTLTCATARPISVNVHPVQKPNDPAIVGSSLVQLDRDGAADLSYDPDVCS